MSQERVSLVLHRKEFKRELGNKVEVVYRIKISIDRAYVAFKQLWVLSVKLFSMGIRERNVLICSQKGWLFLGIGDIPLFCLYMVLSTGVMALVGVSFSMECIIVTIMWLAVTWKWLLSPSWFWPILASLLISSWFTSSLSLVVNSFLWGPAPPTPHLTEVLKLS